MAQPGFGGNIMAAALAAGSSTTIYAVIEKCGVIVSEDGGQTWEVRNQGLPQPRPLRLAAHPKDPDTLWVSLDCGDSTDGRARVPGGVFKSTDGGRHWSALTNGLFQFAHADRNFTSHYKGFAVSAAHPETMLAGCDVWDKQGIFLSTNGGASWTLAARRVETAYPGGPAVTTCFVDPTDSQILYAAGAEYALRSTNGGQTWVDITAHRPNATQRDNWRGNGYSGLCAMGFRFHPTDPQRAMLIAMDAGKVWESRDGRQTWRRHGLQPWPWGGGRDGAYSGDFGYVTCGQFGGWQGIARTTDGGQTWSVALGAKFGLPEQDKGGEPNGVYTDPRNGRNVWASIGGKLFHSGDGGDQWQAIATPRKVYWLAGDPSKPGRFYLSGDKGVFATEDGRQFTHLGGPWPHTRGKLTVDARGRVYLAQYQETHPGVWRWDGRQWERLLDERFVTDVAADPKNPDRLAIMTNDDPYHDVTRATGVWVSTDAGASWARASSGLPMLRGMCVAFNPHNPEQLVCGTQGGGYFLGHWPKGHIPAATRRYAMKEDDRKHAAPENSAPPTASQSGDGVSRFTLVNPGMTEGAEKPEGWTQTWVGQGQIKCYRDTNTFHSAPAALALEAVGGAAQAQVSQRFEVKGGERVQLSGWVRADGGANAMLALQSFSADWKGIDFKVVGNAVTGLDWRKASGEVTLPANAAHAAVVLFLQGPGVAWLDDVSLDGNDPGTNAQPKAAVRPKPQSPPKAKDSCDPAEGFYPDYPQAWRQVLADQLKRASAGNAPLVFLGDSLVQGWSEQPHWKEQYAKLGAVNFGVGGDGTPQLLYRLDKGILDGLNPKVVMLSVGVNNVWPGFGAEDTVKGIKAVVAKIQAKAPNTRILLVSNWHFFDKGDGGSRKRVDTINAALKELADGKKVFLLETSERLLKPDRELELKFYANDKLHLSAEGYRVWAEVMDPALNELMK